MSKTADLHRLGRGLLDAAEETKKLMVEFGGRDAPAEQRASAALLSLSITDALANLRMLREWRTEEKRGREL